MGNDIYTGLKMNLHFRFGQIAIDKGFVTSEQIKEALEEQLSNTSFMRLRPRMLIGEILFARVWITLRQIEMVLEEISKTTIVQS